MIDVTTASVAGADGQLGVALGVDLSKAQVPDRRYAADVCSVARVRGTVKVMFGQERVDGSGWRTLLVIEMSEVAISQFLQSVDSMKNPTLEQIAAGSNFQPEELTEASEPTQPNQAVSLVANLVLTAFAGNEACIDFYHMSPFAVGVVAHTHKLAVEPVVRVDLRSSLLFGLLASLRDLEIPRPESSIWSKAQ